MRTSIISVLQIPGRRFTRTSESFVRTLLSCRQRTFAKIRRYRLRACHRKNAVIIHGGTISAKNNQGGGLEFVLRWQRRNNFFIHFGLLLFHYLCDALVLPPFSKEAIKRESGASPEQSRCCKFHIMLQTMNSLSMPLETFSGKAACNRNKSEDLPCIILSLLSRKKR